VYVSRLRRALGERELLVSSRAGANEGCEARL